MLKKRRLKCKWDIIQDGTITIVAAECGRTFHLKLKKKSIEQCGINYCENCGGRVIVRKGDKQCSVK